MKVEELNKSFDAITPTEGQKEKMLANILDAAKAPQIGKRVRFPKTITAVAAAAVLAVGIFVLSQNQINTKNSPSLATVMGTENNSEDEQKVDSAEAPMLEYSGVLTNRNVGIDAKARNETTVEVIAVLADNAKMDENLTYGAEAEDTYEPAEESSSDDVAEEETEETDSVSTEPTVSETPEKEKAPESVTAPSASNATVSGNVGGGGGGGAAAKGNVLTLEQIEADAVYSKLFPTYFAEDFAFSYANEASGKLLAIFNSSDGRWITVEITKSTSFTVVEADEILKMEDSPIRFALGCDEYYVIYYAETENTEELYKMAVSAPYFN